MLTASPRSVMFPSVIFVSSFLLLSSVSLSAQVVQDVRLSPDDRRLNVLESHQTASACTVGDRTMVVWGTTVGDASGKGRLALMMGVQKEREWLAQPRTLASIYDNPGTVVQVIAIDSVFLILWHAGGEQGEWGLRGRVWNVDGTPVSETLYFGKTPMQGIWSHPMMPGIAVLWRSGLQPVALSWDGTLQVKNVNPIVAPDRSFQIGPDSSLTAILDGKIVRYPSMFDTVPELELEPPISDSSATANVPFIGTVSDSGFSIIVLVVQFSERYSRNGSNNRSTVLTTLHHFRKDKVLPDFDTVARHDEILGAIVPGWGIYREYRTSGVRKLCGDGAAMFIEFASEEVRGGNADGPVVRVQIGFRMDYNGEISDTPQFGIPSEMLSCSPSGDRVSVRYEERDGRTFIRVGSGMEDFLAPAVSEGRSVARREPLLLTEGDQPYLLWKTMEGPWTLRRVNAFNVEGIDSVDVIEFLNLKNLTGNYGCATRIDKHYVMYYPGKLFLSETQLRYCTVAAQGGPVEAHFAMTHVSGLRDGRFGAIAEVRVGPEIRPYHDLWFNHYRALAFEPDDGSVLVSVISDSSSNRYKEPDPWLGCLAESGGFQWQSIEKEDVPPVALPTGGTTWASFHGNGVITRSVDTVLDTFSLPTFDSTGLLVHQSLPGPYLLRANRRVDTAYSIEIQLIDHQTGRFWEQLVSLPSNLEAFTEGIMTHPVDSTRFIVWGSDEGIFAVRYSPDFQEQIMPPTRISETKDVVRYPSAAFVNDTLTVVWQDYRHGTPAIYGLQWKVDAWSGTNSVEDTDTSPSLLDLSYLRRVYSLITPAP